MMTTERLAEIKGHHERYGRTLPELTEAEVTELIEEVERLHEERKQYHWYADVFGAQERTAIVTFLRQEYDEYEPGHGLVIHAAARIEQGEHRKP